MSRIEFSNHPEFVIKEPDWLLYYLLFDGCQAALKSTTYLWPHELESLDVASIPKYAPDKPSNQIAPSTRVRLIREMRTVYTNEVEPVVSRWQSIFFKKEPTADAEVKRLFGEDISDVTGDGKSLNTFIKDEVLVHRILYGRPIIFTDAPDIQVASAGEEQQAGIRPFFRMLEPLEVKDWEIETKGVRKGQFKWVRWEYTQIEPRESGEEKPVINTYSKMLLFNSSGDGKTGTYTCKIYRKERDARSKKVEWKLLDTFTFAGYPNLPVRSIENEESWIKNIAPLALKLFNSESGRDNMLYYQMYQRIFIAANMSEPEKMAMAAYVIGFLPEGAVVHTVEPAQTTSCDNNINETRIALRAVAFNQQRQVPISSKVAESGDTQREYKEALTSVVISELETLENLVNNAIKDYAWFKEKNADFKGKVTFSRDLDLDDLVEEVMFYQQLRDDIGKFPTWKKAVLKKFAKAQNLPDIQKIVKEIDTLKEETQSDGTDVSSRRQRLGSLVDGRATEEDAEGADSAASSSA